MKKSKWKKIILLIVIIAIICIFLYIKFSIKKETSVFSDTIEEQVSKVLELSTVKYNYTNVVAYKDNKNIKGMNLPFTNKGFLIKYSGYIKAGIDMNNAEINVQDPKFIEIKLDKPKVFDNVINEEDLYIYDERESVFNKLSLQDLYDVLVDEKKKMEKEVIEKGLLKEAEKNAKEMLKSLLENMGFEEIKITFK